MLSSCNIIISPHGLYQLSKKKKYNMVSGKGKKVNLTQSLTALGAHHTISEPKIEV